MPCTCTCVLNLLEMYMYVRVLYRIRDPYSVYTMELLLVSGCSDSVISYSYCNIFSYMLHEAFTCVCVCCVCVCVCCVLCVCVWTV